MRHLLLLGVTGAEVLGVLGLLWVLLHRPRRLRQERALEVLASWPLDRSGPPPATTWCRPVSAVVPAQRPASGAQASSSAISASMSMASSSQPLGTRV